MLKIENTEIAGFAPAIRGMRNPKNSWSKSDSETIYDSDFGATYYMIGENDLKLAKALSSGGPVHGKYKRMIAVYLDITAPLYWWKEFDTYKVGTVADSCSTMHKIQSKAFEPSDFSIEHLTDASKYVLYQTLGVMNEYRDRFNESHDKDDWWQMIQLLPTCYNQRRTVMVNYEVLTNIYHSRKDHKLDEWHTMCDWIANLPYAEELIIGEANGKEE